MGIWHLSPAPFFKMIKRLFVRFWERLRSLFFSKSTYYINGTATLPPPLSEAEESELVKNIDHDEARSLLVEHNLRLVVYIAKRFENTGAGIEELISIGTVGLMKAVTSFNREKNIRMATYASRCIENEILMFLRKCHTRRKEVSIDEPLSVDWDGNELLLSDVLGNEADSVYRRMEEDEERRLLRRAVASLNERERVIIDLRFGLESGHEMTQKDVAELLGISQSYISRLEKRIMLTLRRELEGSFH